MLRATIRSSVQTVGILWSAFRLSSRGEILQNVPVPSVEETFRKEGAGNVNKMVSFNHLFDTALDVAKKHGTKR
jgi:hypothetical protein